jgi:hypothetical protein
MGVWGRVSQGEPPLRGSRPTARPDETLRLAERETPTDCMHNAHTRAHHLGTHTRWTGAASRVDTRDAGYSCLFPGMRHLPSMGRHLPIPRNGKLGFDYKGLRPRAPL